VASAAVIIVAAGRGTRLGTPDKVLLPLAGRPLLSYSIAAAESARSVVETIVVAGMHTKPQVERLLEAGGWRKARQVALGGERRQDSVEAGLRLVSQEIDIVAVHDGARPLVTHDLFEACIDAAMEHGAAIAAVAVTDTLKRVRNGHVQETVPRDEMWAAQTPQAVRTELLRESFAFAHANRLEVTDEAGLLEAFGVPVAVVPGSPRNLKITRPEDTVIAEAFLRSVSGSMIR
jgi:2-C-methyl-D-erythritol 4-phosphate cytidylyltransferase